MLPQEKRTHTVIVNHACKLASSERSQYSGHTQPASNMHANSHACHHSNASSTRTLTAALSPVTTMVSKQKDGTGPQLRMETGISSSARAPMSHEAVMCSRRLPQRCAWYAFARWNTLALGRALSKGGTLHSKPYGCRRSTASVKPQP